MNNILTKQNEEINLQRLAAQRELYSSAKRTQFIQHILTIVIPVSLSFLGMFKPEYRIAGVTFGVCMMIFNMVLFERLIKFRREKAAKIQEMFDCKVLEMPISPLKSVDDITVEDVLTNYDAHRKVESNVEKIRDWYSKEINGLPLDVARLICQRSNCSWDISLRRKYLWIIGSIFGIVLVSLIITGIVQKLQFIEILYVISALIPFFTYCIRSYFDNHDSILRLKGLMSYSEKIWKELLSSSANNSLAESSRRLQDEIFSNRSRNVLIPDKIYNLKRDKDEALMNKTVAELSKQFKNR